MACEEYLKVWLRFNESVVKDECGNSWTAAGDPNISAANAKFGKALQLTTTGLGAAGQHIALDGGLTLGGKDFTVDGWAYMPANIPRVARIFSFCNVFGNNAQKTFYVGQKATTKQLELNYNNNWSDLSPNLSEQLFHFAVVYEHSKSLISFYINGQIVGTLNQTFTETFYQYVFVGRANYNNHNTWLGTVDEFRIFDGIARWTENFTPPTGSDYRQALSLNFDAERQIIKSVNLAADAQRHIIKNFNLNFDTQRNIENQGKIPVIFSADAERQIVKSANLNFDTARILSNYLSSIKVLLRFDDDSRPYKDERGNSWTAYNSPSLTSENTKTGKALKLDGGYNTTSELGQYLALDGGLTLGGKDFTVDGWSYMDSSVGSYARLFAFFNVYESNGNKALMLHCDGTGLYLLYDGSKTTTATNLKGTLFHFTINYLHNTNSLTLYINDKKIGSINKNFPETHYDYVFLGRANYKASDTAYYKGTIDEFKIIDGTALNLNFDAVRKIKNSAQEWRYENYGTADLLSISGNTLTNLPETQSKTGSAFWQSTRAKCFDIPATKEIWVKFDVYFDGSNRWRAYNDINNNLLDGISAQQTNSTTGTLSFFAQTNQSIYQAEGKTKKNQLQSVLLHMVSDSSAGIIEAWLDSVKLYTYTGNVNNGADFADIYLQSDGAGTFFSNVIISNAEIEITENVAPLDFLTTWNFDAERILENNSFDAKVVAATKVLLHFDDNSRPYKDERGNRWTSYNNPAIAETNAKFGKALQLDGNSCICLNTIYLGGQDFTIDGIFCANSYPSGDWYPSSWYYIFEFIKKASTSYSIYFGLSNNTAVYLHCLTPASVSIAKSAIQLNVLHHFAVVYQHSAQTISLFIDGQKIGTRTVQFEADTAFFLTLGANSYEGGHYAGFDGTIDEFRIVDGMAVWTNDFTPPTAPYQINSNILNLSFDTERKLSNLVSINLDAVRIVGIPANLDFDTERIISYDDIQLELNFDTERITAIVINENFDTVRNLAHTLIISPAESGFIYSGAANSTGIQSIEINLAAQQLTDQLSYTTVNPVEIMQQVQGQYLDYVFDMRIEEISQRGILSTCKCCSDVDEFLYTQLSYNIDHHECINGVYIVLPYIQQQEEIEKKKIQMLKKPVTYASKHISTIAGILGKHCISNFEDFPSTVDVDQAGVTYQDLISEIFGWTSRLPHKLVNCYIRHNTLYVVQRGHENNTVNLENAKYGNVSVSRKIVRTTWGTSTEEVQYGYSYEFEYGGKILDEELTDEDTPQEPTKPSRNLKTSETHNDNGVVTDIKYEYDADGDLISSHTYSHGKNSVTGEEVDKKIDSRKYYEIINSAKVLYKEETTTYESGKVTDSRVVYHNYLNNGQTHSTDGDNSVTSPGRDEDRPTPYTEKNSYKEFDFSADLGYTYQNGKRIRILSMTRKPNMVDGIALYDSSFPVDDVNILKKLTSELQWLNRKTQETISLDIYDLPHVIDFNDQIIFAGNLYFLENNTVIKNSRIVNKQSILITRWF